MKSFKSLFLLGTMAVSSMVHADYECLSYQGNPLKLSVTESHNTQFGDTLVVQEAGELKKYLFGTITIDEGYLFTKKVVEFYGTSNTLTIVSQPKICERAGCDAGDNIGKYISATLSLDEVSTEFLCNEKNI